MVALSQHRHHPTRSSPAYGASRADCALSHASARQPARPAGWEAIPSSDALGHQASAYSYGSGSCSPTPAQRLVGTRSTKVEKLRDRVAGQSDRGLHRGHGL